MYTNNKTIDSIRVDKMQCTYRFIQNRLESTLATIVLIELCLIVLILFCIVDVNSKQHDKNRIAERNERLKFDKKTTLQA